MMIMLMIQSREETRPSIVAIFTCGQWQWHHPDLPILTRHTEHTAHTAHIAHTTYCRIHTSDYAEHTSSHSMALAPSAHWHWPSSSSSSTQSVSNWNNWILAAAPITRLGWKRKCLISSKLLLRVNLPAGPSQHTTFRETRI